jgi:hypothetical protein
VLDPKLPSIGGGLGSLAMLDMLTITGVTMNRMRTVTDTPRRSGGRGMGRIRGVPGDKVVDEGPSTPSSLACSARATTIGSPDARPDS